MNFAIVLYVQNLYDFPERNNAVSVQKNIMMFFGL